MAPYCGLVEIPTSPVIPYTVAMSSDFASVISLMYVNSQVILFQVCLRGNVQVLQPGPKVSGFISFSDVGRPFKDSGNTTRVRAKCSIECYHHLFNFVLLRVLYTQVSIINCSK